MKTSIEISEEVYRLAEAEAARHGKTVSEFVEETLAEQLHPQPAPAPKATPAFTTISNEQEMKAFLEKPRQTRPANPPPLPTFNGGGLLVDIADRNRLYDILDDLQA